MKQNFERIVKEALESYEMPYESGAWDALSKRLDGTPATPFYRKWWFAATIGTVLVGSATFFALTANDAATDKTPVAAVTATETPAAANTAPATVSPGATHVNKDTQTAIPTQQPPAATPSQVIPTGRPENTVAAAARTTAATPPKTPKEDNSILHTLTGGMPGQLSDVSPATAEAKPLKSFNLPATLCLNETLTIENPNAVDAVVTLPNGTKRGIPAKKAIQVTPMEAGMIYVKAGSLAETTIVKAPAAQLYITADEFILEKGVPVIHFDASGTDNVINWKTASASKPESNNALAVYPFEGTKIAVTAVSTDENGCTVTSDKTIYLEKEYNLVATNAFRPTSTFGTNQHFMPFALTERDTPFELTVIDPKNGAVVFKTNDATRGWDGVDGRNGEMVKEASVWAWKVVMKNPLPGEPSEYKGTITRL